jgi:flap endonuclease-1
MGCKGFWAFLASIVKNESIDNLSGKPIIIDVMLYIYKYIIGIRNNGTDIINEEGNNINHIYAINNLIKIFSEKGILPICVFDGKSPDIKKDTIDKRKNIINTCDVKCKELEIKINLNDEYWYDNFGEDNDTEINEYIKNFKKSFSMNTKIVNECKYLLSCFGIPYVDSVNEADSQCSVLSHYYKNVIPGVLSEDSDILIFGCSTLYRDIDFKTNSIKSININDIMNFLQEKTNIICSEHFKKKIKITRENFIDFTIILGNDYNYGVRCSGGTNREKIFELFVLNDFNVIKFIAHLYQINKICGNIKYYIPDKFIEKWVNSRINYKDAKTFDPSNIPIHMKTPNFVELELFLSDKKISINQIELISNIITKMFHYYCEKKFTFENKKQYDIQDEWIVINNRK